MIGMCHRVYRACLVLLLGRLLALGGDPVLTWNALLLDAIRTDNSPPTLASRNLAILHVAIYDAVNSIERTHQPYRHQLAPNGEASTEAAATGAAHAVLVTLYPHLRAPFDAEYQRHLTSFAPSAMLTNGLQLGRLVGLLTVDSRSDDGANTQVTYIPSEEPGQWRRTPPFFRPPLDPHWRYVEPFCLADIEPFVPPGSPALESAAYAEDLNQVKVLGARTNSIRTAEQSEIAVFWLDFSYTATPPGHWQEIAATISVNQSNTLAQNARLFVLLSLAQADAGIVTWEAKYRYNFWRPVTAIQRADEDGNPATDADLAWTSFLASPPFPEYTSGHSTFSQASAVVLAGFYGTDALPFSIGSDSLPGVFRSFESVSACADEVGLSRVYGGIHFMSANRDGKEAGGRIGAYVFNNFLLPIAALPFVQIESVEPNGCRLRVHGHIGAQCVVEASANLPNWQAVSTNRATVGGFTQVDSSFATHPIRFYRAREE
jgi:hypothetical protein